jgi:hypothetical protein
MVQVSTTSSRPQVQNPNTTQKKKRKKNPVILATQEAEIRRIAVLNQPGKIVPDTLSQKNPSQKRASEVVKV